MKMKIRVLCFLLCAVLLSGCCMKHELVAATCEDPITCAKCGETMGEEIGHVAGPVRKESIPMWGQPGVSRQYCVLCGEQLDEILEEPSAIYKDGKATMDIYGLKERVETVLKECGEEYTCDIAVASSFGLLITVYKDGKELCDIMFDRGEYLYTRDNDEIEGVFMMFRIGKSIDGGKMDEQTMVHIATAFIGCFDATISKADAEDLAGRIVAFMDADAVYESENFTGSSVQIRTACSNGIGALYLEELE